MTASILFSKTPPLAQELACSRNDIVIVVDRNSWLLRHLGCKCLLQYHHDLLTVSLVPETFHFINAVEVLNMSSGTMVSAITPKKLTSN